MKKFNFLPAVAGLLLMFSLSEDYGCGRAGIKGHIYTVSGNQMPGPGESARSPKPATTTLYIYELTNINEVTREGSSPFYNSISTRLIKEVTSDEKGYFRTKLPPGWYSLFVKKDQLFFSSQFDDKNNIHPVEVKKGRMTEIDFRINYDAVY